MTIVKVSNIMPKTHYSSFKKRIESNGGKIFSRVETSKTHWKVIFTSLGHLKLSKKRSAKKLSKKRTVKKRSAKKLSKKR